MGRRKTLLTCGIALLVVASMVAVLPVMAQEGTEHSRDDISQAKYGYDFAELSAETAGQVQAIFLRQPFPAGTEVESILTREELAERRFGGEYEGDSLSEQLSREQLITIQNAYDAQFGALPTDPEHSRDEIARAMFGYDFAGLSAETAGQVQALYNRQPFADGLELAELRTREQLAEALYGMEYDSLTDRRQRISVENQYADQFATDGERPPATETSSETDSQTETVTPAETATPADRETSTSTATPADSATPTVTATPTATATAPATSTATSTATAPATPTATSTATAPATPTATDDSGTSAVPKLEIVDINAEKEWVKVRNEGETTVDLRNIRINYEAGDGNDQIKRLPAYTLDPGETVVIGTGDKAKGDIDIRTSYRGHVLNNDGTDTVRLFTDDGRTIDEEQDGGTTASFLADPFGALQSFLGSLF